MIILKKETASQSFQSRTNNSMKQIFIKELSCFTPDSFADRFDIDLTKSISYIESLAVSGIMRLSLSNDATEHAVTKDDNAKGKYQFFYVGLIVIDFFLIVVYPKYMNEAYFSDDTVSEKTRNKLQQVFRVLRKRAGSYSDINLFSEEGAQENNHLALMIALLEKYGEHGIYSNYVKTLKQNGAGNISWERTISKHLPFIQADSPIYFNYETIENTRDASDYVARLHRCVLTECSKLMQESGISEILELDDIELSTEELADFGDSSYLNYRLNQELNAQYVTWKQDIISLLMRYVNSDPSALRSGELVCLGTSSFYHNWEEACKVVLGNLLGKPIGNLGLELDDGWKTRSHETLLNVVPRPKWTAITNNGFEACSAVSTLVPDIIAFWRRDNEKLDFGIFDAKYYTPILSPTVKGVPGVDSVSKQILYQRAYKSFILDNRFNKVINAFLVPSDGNEHTKLGHVGFPGVFEPEQELFADGVTMWELSAADVWQCYLSDTKLPDIVLSKLFEN